MSKDNDGLVVLPVFTELFAEHIPDFTSIESRESGEIKVRASLPPRFPPLDFVRTMPLAVDTTINERFNSDIEVHIIEFSIRLKREYNIIINGSGLTLEDIEVRTTPTGAWKKYTEVYADSYLQQTSSDTGILITGIFSHGSIFEIGRGNYGNGKYRFKIRTASAGVQYSVRLEMNLDEYIVTGSDFTSALWQPREILHVSDNAALAMKIKKRVFIAKDSVYYLFNRIVHDEFLKKQLDLTTVLLRVSLIAGANVTTIPEFLAYTIKTGVDAVGVLETFSRHIGVPVGRVLTIIVGLIPNLNLKKILESDIKEKSGLVIHSDREHDVEYGLVIDQTHSISGAGDIGSITSGTMTVTNILGTGMMTTFERWSDFPKLIGVKGWRDVNGFEILRANNQSPSPRNNIHYLPINVI